MRLAFFTPLNPTPSGISDYSEELLPFLRNLADIDIITGPYQPTTEAILKQFRILQVSEFLKCSSSYDQVIYQIGNNYKSHGYMLSCLAAVPGIVVLHDYSLTYLMLPVTLGRGDIRSVRTILEPTFKKEARAAALRLLLGQMDPYEVSLARPIIEMSRAVIVHNHHAFRKLSAEFPQKRIERISHATPLRNCRENTSALRTDYGFRADDFIIASVSSLAYNKRIDLTLQVLATLRCEFPRVKLVMVGQGDLGSRSRRLLHSLGLEQSVVQTGWVSNQQYLDYIDLADVVVDLRYPTAGETSGSSLRAMQAAKALVVSAEGFFLELPDSCCVRLPVDGQEVRTLYSALAALIQDPARRKSLGEAGREFALTHLRLEQAASSYIAFAQDVASSKCQPSGSWSFPSDRGINITGKLTSFSYRLGRLNYYFERYGIRDTLRRIGRHI